MVQSFEVSVSDDKDMTKRLSDGAMNGQVHQHLFVAHCVPTRGGLPTTSPQAAAFPSGVYRPGSNENFQTLLLAA